MNTTETIRLYDEDAYATSFTGTVLSCKEVTKSDKTYYDVILDKTLFFPEEGGQSPDKGTLGKVDVLDVQIKNGIITHTLSAPLDEGASVEGEIDWKHRFSNMQQHSGEHIFSGIVHNRFGFDNVGFHLSDQIVTMDFNGVMSAEQIADIEYEVNNAISKNVDIIVSYPSKEELKALEYRSKIEIEGQVRIVTVTGYDVCACCAPHVRKTGEIGGLKVMSIQNYKGGVRISILCGFRMLEAFREKSAIINELTNFLTTGQENLLDTVTKLKNTNQALSSQLASVKQAALEQKLADIPAGQKDVIVFESGIDTKIVRNVVNGLMENHDGVCALFVGDAASDSEDAQYNYVIGSKTVDCKELANTLRTQLGAKGGGNSQMIQGSVCASAKNISECLL